jgi:hypothetical protein
VGGETRAVTRAAASRFVPNKLRLKLVGKGKCGVVLVLPPTPPTSAFRRQQGPILSSNHNLASSDRKGQQLASLTPRVRSRSQKGIPDHAFVNISALTSIRSLLSLLARHCSMELSRIKPSLMKSTSASICPDRPWAAEISCPFDFQVAFNYVKSHPSPKNCTHSAELYAAGRVTWSVWRGTPLIDPLPYRLIGGIQAQNPQRVS